MNIRHAFSSAPSWALLHTCFCIAVGCGGGGSGDVGLDAGTDAGADATTPEVDADVQPDASVGCIEAAVPGTWAMVTVDDVLAAYSAGITPNIGSQPWDLYFESRHMFDPDTGGPVELAGTFELGAGADDNYGTCGEGTFDDGAVCNCECGILDRDCGDPSRPIVGCAAGQLCRPIVAGPIGPFFGDSVCANDCDREAGVGCPPGQACVDHAFGDLCNATTSELDRTADLGEICAEGALHCAIDAMGMSNGYCDLFARGDRRCQPRCSQDSDCNTAAFEHCYVVGGDSSSGTEVPFGYCALRYPDGWSCGGGGYQDGTTCDCECGLVDPDCYDPELPVAGCESGEVCDEGNCAAP